MKKAIKNISALLLVLALSSICNAETGPATPHLELSIDANGKVGLGIEIPNQQNPPASPFLSGSGYSITFALIPFEYNSSWVIHTAPDVRASILSHGPGYTMICLLHPVGQAPIIVGLNGAVQLDETADDNAKIEFDYSYPFLSGADAAVTKLPQAFSLWDVTFVLPKEYSKYRVNTHPKAMVQMDARSYNLPLGAIKNSPGKVWIVFPDPRKASLSYAMIILGLLFGIFSALFQIIPLKERRIAVLIIIFVLSAIFLVISLYLLFTLPKKLDLAVWIAVSLPHVLVSGFACLYLVAARKLQATIGGTISIDGRPTNFAEVRLLKCQNGGEKVVEKKERVDQGQYEFHIWVRHMANFKVVARSKITEPVESPEFGVKPRDTHPVGELCLFTPKILQDTDIDDQQPTNESSGHG